MKQRLRIYVAARFEEWKKVLGFQHRLRLAGHSITCDWAQHAKEHPDYFKAKPTGVDRQMIAMAEINGVERCDALIIFPHPEGASAYAECTVAIALKRRVIAVSPHGLKDSDRTFLHHPDIQWLQSEEQALAELSPGIRIDPPPVRPQPIDIKRHFCCDCGDEFTPPYEGDIYCGGKHCAHDNG